MTFSLLGSLTDHESGKVSTLGRRLRNRELPKRACVFGRSMVAPIMPIKSIFPDIPAPSYARIFRQTIGAALEPLRRRKLPAKTQAELEAAIVHEAAQLVQAVRPRAPDLLPHADEPPLVTFLPTPDLEEKRKDCIVLENRELVRSSSRSVSDEQSDAADIFKSLGYVLTAPDWRIPVFLATRIVLYNKTTPLRDLSFSSYGDELAPDGHNVKCIGRVFLDFRATIRRAGLNIEAVHSLQRAAEDVGYFDKAPLLAREATDHRIEEIAGRLGDFSGQGNWRVSAASSRTFVSQFPPRLRPDLLDALVHILDLDRVTITRDLVRAIRQVDPQGKRRYICALSPDSGQFVRMILQQEVTPMLSSEGWTFSKSIRNVVKTAEAGDCVILCDDNSTSGNQAECQLMAWLTYGAISGPRNQKKEAGISDVALDARDVNLLKEMDVGVAVCAGSDEANVRLQKRAAELGIKRFLGVKFHEPIKPHSVQLAPNLREFLTDVGADLLAYARYGEAGGAAALGDAQKKICNSNALGYGNAEGLLTTIFNVPVSTITALWCPGLAKGAPWTPLLIRRGYLKHLVIS